MADPGFPRSGGANPPEGRKHNFAKFSQRLHEIEKIWTLGGGAESKILLYRSAAGDFTEDATLINNEKPFKSLINEIINSALKISIPVTIVLVTRVLQVLYWLCNSADIYSHIFGHISLFFSFGAHETSVRQLLWGSRPLAVKVAVKYDISISVGISSNVVSALCQSHWLAVTS